MFHLVTVAALVSMATVVFHGSVAEEPRPRAHDGRRFLASRPASLHRLLGVSCSSLARVSAGCFVGLSPRVLPPRISHIIPVGLSTPSPGDRCHLPCARLPWPHALLLSLCMSPLLTCTLVCVLLLWRTHHSTLLASFSTFLCSLPLRTPVVG